MNKKDMKKLIELWEFLDADMPSKIFPDEKLNGEIWTREDNFRNKKEVEDYLTKHFLVAFPELNKTQFKAKRNKEGLTTVEQVKLNKMKGGIDNGKN